MGGFERENVQLEVNGVVAMDSSLKIGSVARESELRPVPSGQSTEIASIPPKEVSTSTSARTADDAVVLNIASKRTESDKQEIAPRITSENDAMAVASDIAKNLRSAAKQIQQTVVTFDLSIQKEGRSTLSFQVVDKDSGEIVRQFPPDVAAAFSKQAEIPNKKGALVEDAA